MKSIVNSMKILILMIILTGIIYPSFVTLTGKLFFNKKVNGSLIVENNKIIGSELIGQNFNDSKYFIGRPSISGYDTLIGGASNKSITNKEFQNFINENYKQLVSKYKTDYIPQELYTASGSGLDPNISKVGALVQVNSISLKRGFDNKTKENLIKLVNQITEKRTFGVLGEERINVLKLNIALDKLEEN